MRRGGRGALLLIPALLGACGEEAGVEEESRVTRTDSAGVEIVVTNRAAWGEGQGWALADRPEIDWGGVEAPPEHQFEDVAGVLVQSDRTVVVVDQGWKRISRLDSDGTILNSYGRPGEGPDEFAGPLTATRLAGDSILVFDRGLLRATVLAPGLERVRSRGFEGSGDARPEELHGLRDGTLLVVATPSIGEALRESEGAYARPPLRLASLGWGEEAPRELARVTGHEYLEIHAAGRILFGRPLLGRRASVAVTGDGRILTGTGDRMEVAVLDPSGRLERLIRYPAGERPVPPEEVESVQTHIFELAEADPRARPFAEAAVEQSPVPDLWPAFGDILVDREGHVWLLHFRSVAPADPDAPQEAVVVHPDGSVLGGVPIPGRLRITDVGRDYVAGWWPDDLGVPHVAVHSLHR